MKYLKAIRDFAAQSVLNTFITLWAVIIGVIVVGSVAPALLVLALLGAVTALFAWMIHDILS